MTFVGFTKLSYVAYRFVFSPIYKSMIGSDQHTKYKKGDNPELDKKFEAYKKVNLFAGGAYHDALSQKEAKRLIKLWEKATRARWRLNVQDVKTLVYFTERILTWRRTRQRELTRIRVEKARAKLKNDAKNGIEAAVIKLNKIKKANAVRTAKCREMRKKVRGKT